MNAKAVGIELPTEGLIRQKELLKLLPISSATLWRRVKDDPGFPKPVKLGPRITAWRCAEIRKFMSEHFPTIHVEGAH